jgi:hypothetical protein
MDGEVRSINFFNGVLMKSITSPQMCGHSRVGALTRAASCSGVYAPTAAAPLRAGEYVGGPRIVRSPCLDPRRMSARPAARRDLFPACGG